MNIFRILFVLAVVWILGGCAKVMPLTGGDEDKTPPSYRSSKPDTFSLNFKGKELVIRFDEYINLVDATKEIIVSPPIEPAPEYMGSGKAVKVKFKEPLKENITYVFNFGQSITDNTEGNKLTGFTFVFSTGNYLDSGSVKGRISDAFSGKPSEGFKVMLYETGVTDSFPYKEKPFYLAYTDAGGYFTFQNLRQGDYKIFTLKEDNNNYIYDRPGEHIGYREEIVSAQDSVAIQMVSFLEDDLGKAKYNRAKSISASRTDFYFSGKADKAEIKPFKGISDSLWYREYNTTKDTVTVWHIPVMGDSAFFFVQVDTVLDTANVKVVGSLLASSASGKRARGGQAASANFSLDASGNQKFDLYSQPTLTFVEPPISIDTSKIHVLADSVPVTYQIIPDSISPRKYRLDFAASAKKKYTVVMDSAAVIQISGKVTPQNSFSFGFRESVEYASVKVNLGDTIFVFPRIWQLLKGDQVLREISGKESDVVTFSRLEPGTYRLRLVIDENGNGKWDTGNYLKKRQPEVVLYMSDNIELKPGWDSEITWNFKKGRGKR